MEIVLWSRDAMPCLAQNLCMVLEGWVEEALQYV